MSSSGPQVACSVRFSVCEQSSVDDVGKLALQSSEGLGLRVAVGPPPGEERLSLGIHAHLVDGDAVDDDNWRFPIRLRR